jgi:hypothetical protein
MNRFLAWFNLGGVFALGALCLMQWHTNRQLNLEVNRLEQARLEHAARIEEKVEAATNQDRELAVLRTELGRAIEERRQGADQLSSAERGLR